MAGLKVGLKADQTVESMVAPLVDLSDFQRVVLKVGHLAVLKVDLMVVYSVLLWAVVKDCHLECYLVVLWVGYLAD